MPYRVTENLEILNDTDKNLLNKRSEIQENKRYQK